MKKHLIILAAFLYSTAISITIILFGVKLVFIFLLFLAANNVERLIDKYKNPSGSIRQSIRYP
jgi:hypothetical protein